MSQSLGNEKNFVGKYFVGKYFEILKIFDPNSYLIFNLYKYNKLFHSNVVLQLFTAVCLKTYLTMRKLVCGEKKKKRSVMRSISTRAEIF